MKSRAKLTAVLAAALLAAPGGAGGGPRAAAARTEKQWTDRFNTPACVWSSTGKNDFFILEPGDQATFDGHDGKVAVHLVITVLNETKKIGSVETRVVEERETHDGKLEEVSRNYFAVCGPTNDVFYFGEDVDLYKDGKVEKHEGSWVAEKDGARPGLFMPSRTLLGARFYQEMAPGVAMDRVEIESDSETLKTPAGEFRECLRTKETTPLEPDANDYKIYARGVGMISDGGLLISKHTNIGGGGH
jgi:hypothetical protein